MYFLFWVIISKQKICFCSENKKTSGLSHFQAFFPSLTQGYNYVRWVPQAKRLELHILFVLGTYRKSYVTFIVVNLTLDDLDRSNWPFSAS